MNTVFVYGLLKPGGSLHHVVAPFIQRTSSATAMGRVYQAQYPAGRFDAEGEVEGFVFWLDPERLEEALRVLDEVEDEGEMYERRVITVRTVDGPVEAYAYQYLLKLPE